VKGLAACAGQKQKARLHAQQFIHHMCVKIIVYIISHLYAHGACTGQSTSSSSVSDITEITLVSGLFCVLLAQSVAMQPLLYVIARTRSHVFVPAAHWHHLSKTASLVRAYSYRRTYLVGFCTSPTRVVAINVDCTETSHSKLACVSQSVHAW
jgi:hypothetical protein